MIAACFHTHMLVTRVCPSAKGVLIVRQSPQPYLAREDVDGEECELRISCCPLLSAPAELDEIDLQPRLVALDARGCTFTFGWRALLSANRLFQGLPLHKLLDLSLGHVDILLAGRSEEFVHARKPPQFLGESFELVHLFMVVMWVTQPR